ncbi:WD domain protein [Aspergillus lucknowensis]|uniref:Probable E3 ubiquitin ligase complex SCF subunit sconB n=1 Tax=Aspergillus lucknowensis TaxID=176173 RepID=A0ABR4LGI2_9EURO
MPKRGHNDELSKGFPPKRQRTTETGRAPDHLSSLSNEVLLHVLSFLPVQSLITCQRLSHRFYALAGDSELWKRQYFSKWVRPRARRFAMTRRPTFPQSKFEYSPRVSTWLDHGRLNRNERVTNWKRQYQLRHNWSKGSCRITEVEIPRPPRPPMLATLCTGFVFTADSQAGLRAWSAERPGSCKAELTFIHSSTPTALTAACGPETNCIEVAVGFADGRFNIYKMDTAKLRLDLRFSCSRSAHGAVTAVASSYPYLMVISEHMILSLYKLPFGSDSPGAPDAAYPIASLKADNMLSPMSLSVRPTGPLVVASIVYSIFHLGCGWSLGIQELHFDKSGQQVSSRLTTTVDTQYGVVHLHMGRRHGRSSAPDRRSITHSHTDPFQPIILHQDPPTSVSYSHPYLLTSHADNTLTVYLVVSNSDSLYVRGGKRLWGHTSSVSAVQVSDRGKAVSVSSRGDEVRIWELESSISPFADHQASEDDNSVKVSPNKSHTLEGGDLGLLSGMRARSPLVDVPSKATQGRGYIGFDDERLLLLREKEYAQLLEFYDFT